MCRCFLVGMIVLCACCVPTLAKGENEEKNPVINKDGKAWKVRYHRDDPSGNGGGGDIAIQLKICRKGPEEFYGYLYRYNRIREKNGKVRYILRPGGRIRIDGTITTFSEGTRCRVGIEGSGTYSVGGNNYTVTLKAKCHPGESGRRGDDRLVMDFIDDRPSNSVSKKSCCGNESCRVALGELLGLIGKEPTEDEVRRAYEKVVFECEDESDDDVLEEEPFEEEPEYEEDEDEDEE